MSMPVSWRVFLGFRIPLPVCIGRWPARLEKFKAHQSSDSSESAEQKSLTCHWGSQAWVVWGLGFAVTSLFLKLVTPGFKQTGSALKMRMQ